MESFEVFLSSRRKYNTLGLRLLHHGCGKMPKTYKHLNLNERDILGVLKSKARSFPEISIVLRRSPRSLSRELKRNAHLVYNGSYLSHRAQERAD
jgi:IS30 family transposase